MDERKGEQPIGQAAEDEARRRKAAEAPREGAPSAAEAREEEGWSQPESSAQKGPSAPEQPGPERK